jgi:transposase
MNCNTQNAKIASITEKTLIVGIDVGSESHFARAFGWRNYEYSNRAFEFSNSESGFRAFKAWMDDIAEKAGKDVVIPGMEPTGHYWFNLGHFLQDNGMRPVHVNPHHVKKSKELDDNNPSKNDRKDPKTIAALVNEGRFSYPYIPTGIYAEIRGLSNLRFQTQEELTRIKNRMARWYSIYFPEIKDVYKNLDSVSGMMIIKEAPLPSDIVTLGVEGVNRIWRAAKLRAAGIKRAMTLVKAATNSIGSREGSECARLEIRNLLNDFEVYANRMEELMQKIEEKLSEIPYIDKVLEIKGIGSKIASGFIAEVGDISRFDNPKQLQKLAGYGIVSNDSGKHDGKNHISYRGRKRLRYVLYEAAISVIGKNQEFSEIHAYYRTRKNNPLKKMQSVVAVACKVLRVFWAILTKGVDYDGQKMMLDIERPSMEVLRAA